MLKVNQDQVIQQGRVRDDGSLTRDAVKVLSILF